MLTLADAILQEDVDSVQQMLRYGGDVNQIDEYGFTPLIEASIIDNIKMCELLLQHGASPNQQDVTGGTALQWAVENNNLDLCKLLLDHRANPNAYNFAGQPVLVMAILRRQKALRQLLIQAGADEVFAQDYINTKLLGHLFELIGTANIIGPTNQLVEVDFEGFILEVTLAIAAETLAQFKNHFSARKLRRYLGIAQFIVEVIGRAAQLIKHQQYRIDIRQFKNDIDRLIEQDPILIPVGYEVHAITFIKFGRVWVKCDRREDSRLYDNVMFYRIMRPENATTEFIKQLMYTKQTSEFINQELDQLLGLQPLTELKIEAQISGNCSWANVEATIPAIFFLVLMQLNSEESAAAHHKSLALNFFHRWRDCNKERALQFCIQRFKEGDVIRKASHAEILAAILFQRCDYREPADQKHIENILSVLLHSPYEYILKNYLRVYYYETQTEDGKRFAELLKEYGYKV